MKYPLWFKSSLFQRSLKFSLKTKTLSEDIAETKRMKNSTKKAVDKIFRLGDSTIVYPENFVNIDFDKFEGFGLKAFDAATILRINDTELKYVFNFLENHLSKGDKFVIKLESVLYSCTSCQRYLLSMQKYAKSQGKIIEIEFISNTKVTSIPKLNNTLGL